jgi:hypothetical protein
MNMPDQRSVTDQLQALIALAHQNGLYDAADWLRTAVASMAPAMYMIDGDAVESDESWTLEQMIRSNEDTFCEEDVRLLKLLQVGQSLSFGGGAWAEFVIRRVQ